MTGALSYAYASAGLDQEVKSVRQYMRDDLKTELYDVVMLAESRHVYRILAR